MPSTAHSTRNVTQRSCGYPARLKKYAKETGQVLQRHVHAQSGKEKQEERQEQEEQEERDET